MNDAIAQLKIAFLQELPAINNAIQAEINALPPLVRPVAEHVMNAGGKRLRPMLTILFARALGFRGDHLHTLASSLEFLHSATLMHDDIVDNADLRRGQAAAHTLFGVAPTILAGDVLLALANELVARTGNPELTSCIAQAIMQTASGEIMEIAALRNPKITRQEYIDIITGKTAYLIQSACEFGVIAAGAGARTRQKARTFGLNLGIAFQLVDDALDYTSRSDTSGKPLGGDLREGKFTLPLLLYLESLPATQRETLILELADANLDPARQDLIVAAIAEQGFADRTRAAARSYLENASQALAVLPEGQEKRLLKAMMHFVITREK
ncbi:MAG: polyprenyl synthetase family protein [Desulfovibrionales bacterium]|nr:polyprenyl synthetase family protein [Desulfovibrionales bacterium]